MIKTMRIPGYDPATSRTLYGDAAGVKANPDTNGVRWALADIEGWNDGADVRSAIFERPFADGAILDSFQYAPRVLELRGGLLAPDQLGAKVAVRFLEAAFEVRDNTFTDNLVSLLCAEYFGNPDPQSANLFLRVRRAGRPVFVPSLGGLAYEFSVPLIAPDPRKYGDNEHVVVGNAVGAYVASVYGTTPTRAQVIFHGPVTNPVFHHAGTGWDVKFIGTLPAGQSASFDTFTHGVSGSFDRSFVDPTTKWWPLIPGSNTISMSGTGTAGSTTWDLYWFDAYQ